MIFPRQFGYIVVVLFIVSAGFLPPVLLGGGLPGEHLISAPAYLRVGDILFCDVKADVLAHAEEAGYTHLFHQTGSHNDHCALYIGGNTFVEAIPYRMSSNGTWYGVVKSHISWYHLWAANISYATIEEATPKQREDAVAWALTQLYHPYKIHLYRPFSLYTQQELEQYQYSWYCSELIGAAYDAQGVSVSSSSPYMIQDLLTNVSFYEQQTPWIWYPGAFKDWALYFVMDIMNHKYQEPV